MQERQCPTTRSTSLRYTRCRGGVAVKSKMVYKLCKYMVYTFTAKRGRGICREAVGRAANPACAAGSGVRQPRIVFNQIGALESKNALFYVDPADPELTVEQTDTAVNS